MKRKIYLSLRKNIFSYDSPIPPLIMYLAMFHQIL